MQGIFIECEKIFRARTSTFQTSIDSTSLVSEMLQNCHVLSSYKVLNQKYLMKSVLTFWKKCLCCLREFGPFFYAEDIREKYKSKKKQVKKSSLRTEIKKASSSTDMGH